MRWLQALALGCAVVAPQQASGPDHGLQQRATGAAAHGGEAEEACGLAHEFLHSRHSRVADVLLWWCDRKCTTCGGVKLGEIATCDACKGFGTREVPHDAEGLRISEHIAAEVDQSRRGTVDELRRMRGRKEWAAGKKSVTLRT